MRYFSAETSDIEGKFEVAESCCRSQAQGEGSVGRGAGNLGQDPGNRGDPLEPARHYQNVPARAHTPQ